MSETTTTVPMDDKALFDAATNDASPAAEAPAAEAAPEAKQASAEPARDEQGRFAPKTIEQPAEAGAEPVKTEAPAQHADVIPPWRLREEAEARRSAESRASQLENQLRQLSGRLQQLEKPPEPIDPYVDPEKFRDEGMRQAIDPVARQIQELREYNSRMLAEMKHGEQTVKDAYGWLQQATNSGDPKAGPVLQRAMNSIDPFGEIIKAFKSDKAISTVGDDPNAWFEKELERRKADPEFAAKHLTPAAQNGATNIVKLPPSLNRQPGTAGNASPGSFDDRDLYDSAIR